LFIVILRSPSAVLRINSARKNLVAGISHPFMTKNEILRFTEPVLSEAE
jgi:hypothetical protein